MTDPVVTDDGVVERCAREFYYEAQGINRLNNGLRSPNWSNIDLKEREQLCQCIRAALAASDRVVLVERIAAMREMLSMFVNAAKPRGPDGHHEMPRFSAREIELARAALVSLEEEIK